MRKIVVAFCLVFTMNIFAGFSLSDLGSAKKYFKKAEQLFNAGNYQQAIPNYLKYLSKKKNQKDEKALYHISICYMETGNPQSGFSFIKQLYQLKGTELKYAVLYAEYLVQLNKLQDAINVYKGVIAIYPDDYLSYVRLGELLVNNGQLKEARKMWNKAITLKDRPTEAYALLSESYLNVEKNKLLAYYYARKLYEIAPDEKKPGIKSMLNSIAGDFKDDFENYYLLRTCKEKAKLEVQKGDYLSAFSTLSRCEDLENIDEEYLLMFADIAKKLKKWDKALELYKKCLALGFESGQTYLELAKCYLKTGNLALAKVNLKMAMNYKDTKEEALKLLNSI
ncbi:hypothetical protein TTHT_0766 [Thermotomaculum hydrothermale]|uniref:Tetratricopeptide repeat protein n=1 Tax=Thermotomaculum hydrothermale TaxID=981385 RepID=A0A7R6PGT4_9BACT|nr:tetratricopeptide repeat protein [Thermotomaculum hydrothermale]BBB32334.1 hypothetical protein TTHT_0766 [Thermotomaculum hydrothermale]